MYFASRPWQDAVRFLRDGVYRTILSKPIPAGSYTAEMKAIAISFTDDFVQVECRLPGATDMEMVGGITSIQVELSLTSAFVHPGGAVELSCRANNGDPNADITIQTATLILTEVASVN